MGRHSLDKCLDRIVQTPVQTYVQKPMDIHSLGRCLDISDQITVKASVQTPVDRDSLDRFLEPIAQTPIQTSVQTPVDNHSLDSGLDTKPDTRSLNFHKQSGQRKPSKERHKLKAIIFWVEALSEEMLRQYFNYLKSCISEQEK